MNDGSPFGLAGLWENWRDPNTDEWERTFAVITVPSNELVGQIHNRMPAILEPRSYERWLGLEPDPHHLLITYPKGFESVRLFLGPQGAPQGKAIEIGPSNLSYPTVVICFVCQVRDQTPKMRALDTAANRWLDVAAGHRVLLWEGRHVCT
jgi:hypothetical protein